MKKQWTTVLDFIQHGKVTSKYQIVEVQGMDTVGDGGALTLVRTGAVGTPSQSFIDTGNNTCVDKNGDVWGLQEGTVVTFNNTDDWFGNGFGSKDEGTYLFQNDSWDRVTLYDDVGYMGLWGIDVTKAYKGQAVQTQVSGTPTGQYFTALQNTTVDPVGDDVNWREVVSVESFSQYTDIVYKASGGNSAVENMVAGVPIEAKVGDKVSTGETSWVRVGASGGMSDFEATSTIYAVDFNFSGSGDETVTFQLLMQSARGGDKVSFDNAPSDIAVSSGYTRTDSITIEGDVNVDFGGNPFKFEGQITDLNISLNNSISFNSPAITLTDASQITDGDVLVIHDTRDGSFNPARPYYRNGEFVSVVSKTGNTITLKHGTLSSYDGDVAIKIYKVAKTKFVIDGPTFSNCAVSIRKTLYPEITCNVNNNYEVSALDFDKTLGAIIGKGDHICTSPSASQEYGLAIRGSQDVIVRDGVKYGSRHGVAITSGGDETAQPPSRNVRVIGATIDSLDSHAADMHGHVSDAKYVDCNILNGAEIGGENTSVEGGVCIARNRGNCLGHREIKGGEIAYRGIKNVSNTTVNSFIIGQNSSLETENTDTEFDLVYEDLRVSLNSNNNPLALAGFNFATTDSIYCGIKITDIVISGSIGQNFDRFVSCFTSGNIKLRSLVVNNIYSKIQQFTEWTKDGGMLDNGVTRLTFPSQIIRNDITILANADFSDEVVFAYPTKYTVLIPSFNASRLKGTTDGGKPFLTAEVTRAQFSTEARVRLLSTASGSDSSDQTELVQLSVECNDLVYDSNYLPA